MLKNAVNDDMSIGNKQPGGESHNFKCKQAAEDRKKARTTTAERVSAPRPLSHLLAPTGGCVKVNLANASFYVTVSALFILILFGLLILIEADKP